MLEHPLIHKYSVLKSFVGVFLLLYIRRSNMLNIFFGSFENMLEMVPIQMSNQGMCVFFHMLKWDMKVFWKGPFLQIKVSVH